MKYSQSSSDATVVVSSARNDVQRVRSIRTIATGLLIAAFCLYLIVRVFEKQFPWLGIVGAFAEASVVGGLADWFAVVALFRHPLGIKLKHTAILPNNKDKIAEGLADFVEKRFLTPQNIEEQLRSIGCADRLSHWLNEKKNIATCVSVLSDLVPKVVAATDDEELRRFVREHILGHLKEMHIAPHIAGMLKAFVKAGRHQEVFGEVLRTAASMIRPNRTMIWNKVRKKLPNIWLVSDNVATAFTDGLVNGSIEELEAAASDPNHTLRQQFNLKVNDFILELETSDKYSHVIEDLKIKFVSETGVSEFINSAWHNFKKKMLAEMSVPSSELCRRLGEMISGLGLALQKDDAFRQKLDQYILSSASTVAEYCGPAVAKMIKTQFAKWDANETAKILEEKVGEDLQFIRINGAMVGGVVGVVLFVINKFLLN